MRRFLWLRLRLHLLESSFKFFAQDICCSGLFFVVDTWGGWVVGSLPAPGFRKYPSLERGGLDLSSPKEPASPISNTSLLLGGKPPSKISVRSAWALARW